jgi:hypothetical protein
MANPQREIEQRAKVIFERCAARNLAAMSSRRARLNWWACV